MLAKSLPSAPAPDCYQRSLTEALLDGAPGSLQAWLDQATSDASATRVVASRVLDILCYWPMHGVAPATDALRALERVAGHSGGGEMPPAPAGRDKNIVPVPPGDGVIIRLAIMGRVNPAWLAPPAEVGRRLVSLLYEVDCLPACAALGHLVVALAHNIDCAEHRALARAAQQARHFLELVATLFPEPSLLWEVKIIAHIAARYDRRSDAQG